MLWPDWPSLTVSLTDADHRLPAVMFTLSPLSLSIHRPHSEGATLPWAVWPGPAQSSLARMEEPVEGS